LCHDSPEGHDPSGPAGSEDADVKGMLSFSFRACHESRYVRDAMLIRLFSSKCNPLVNLSKLSCARSTSNLLMGLRLSPSTWSMFSEI
jgi:hypothetical protein